MGAERKKPERIRFRRGDETSEAAFLFRVEAAVFEKILVGGRRRREFHRARRPEARVGLCIVLGLI